MNMGNRIRHIVRKEFLQAFREPRMRAMMFVPPMVQLVVFGFAVNLDVENAHIGWMDGDQTVESRELLGAFEGSPVFEVTATPASPAEAVRLLDRAEVQAVISVLPGFGSDIHRGKATAVQILVDGSNSNTAALVSAYAGQVATSFANRVMAGQQNQRMLERGLRAPASQQLPNVVARTRVWFNPALRSRNYFVPGVAVNILMIVTISLTALAIVREKEIGTMEQLMVTPIRPAELMLGKMLPFAVVGIVDLGLITGAALLIFRVPFRGSTLLLLGTGILFLTTTLGVGLFISTISRTQQQAMMSMFFVSAPGFMLSGFAFPIQNMPEAIQYLTYLNPMRYFMEIVRGIFLKGVGVEVLWPQMLALAAFGIAIIGLSAARFHKTLE
jgi:ABC-2 type transport system permease protein